MARAVNAWFLLVAAAVVLIGCGQSPTSRARADRGSTVQPKAEGDVLAARGEYEAAAIKYQAALNQEPNDVSLRFALGTALSYLGHREETIQQFRFVVARGKPDMPEVQVAHRWLVSVGAITDTVSLASAPTSDEQATVDDIASSGSQAVVQGGKVKGRTQLKGKPREVNMVLVSKDEKKIDMALTRTVKLGEAFEFDNVPPGNYRLIVEDPENETQLWNLDVMVTPGKDVALNLK